MLPKFKLIENDELDPLDVPKRDEEVGKLKVGVEPNGDGCESDGVDPKGLNEHVTPNVSAFCWPNAGEEEKRFECCCCVLFVELPTSGVLKTEVLGVNGLIGIP